MKLLVELYKFMVVFLMINFALELVVGCREPYEKCEQFVAIKNSWMVLPGAWVACYSRTAGR